MRYKIKVINLNIDIFLVMRSRKRFSVLDGMIQQVRLSRPMA